MKTLHVRPPRDSSAEECSSLAGSEARKYVKENYDKEGLVELRLVLPYWAHELMSLTRAKYRWDTSVLEMTLACLESLGVKKIESQGPELSTLGGESGGAFKGVLWPRPPVQMPDGRTGYPVAFAGVVILDQPLFGGNDAIDRAHGASAPPLLELSDPMISFVPEGLPVKSIRISPGLGEALNKIARGHARHKLGTADDVLTSLDTAGPLPSEDNE